jgi:hypothetical protein
MTLPGWSSSLRRSCHPSPNSTQTRNLNLIQSSIPNRLHWVRIRNSLSFLRIPSQSWSPNSIQIQNSNQIQSWTQTRSWTPSQFRNLIPNSHWRNPILIR